MNAIEISDIFQLLMNYGAMGAVTAYVLFKMEKTMQKNTESNEKLANLIQLLLAKGAN